MVAEMSNLAWRSNRWVVLQLAWLTSVFTEVRQCARWLRRTSVIVQVIACAWAGDVYGRQGFRACRAFWARVAEGSNGSRGVPN